MNAVERDEIIALVTKSPLPIRQSLSRLGLPRSTYYRWLKPQESSNPRIPWNKLNSEEEDIFVTKAIDSPELSHRQLALKITDNGLYYPNQASIAS